MIDIVRRVLSYQMTIAEWIGAALMVGIPYLVVGVVWAATHTGHLSQTHGADRVISFLGSTASWPVLLVSNVCMS